MQHEEKIYIEKNGVKVFGEKLPVISCNRDEYYFHYMTVFQDRIVNCGGYKDLDQIRGEIAAGKLLNNVPDDVELECDLGMITSSKFDSEKKNEDLIKEIEDTIKRLNNQETRQTVCEQSYKNYLINPSEDNLNVLKEKFNDLPEHQKVLFEYIDVKDPLCKLMNGTEEHTFANRQYILKHYFKYDL